MEENNNEISYKRVTSYSNDREEKVSFGKHFFLPFLSGALGATLIVGTCFGVPSIKEKLIGKDTTTVASTDSLTTGTVTNNNLISLSNYSDTGISVAEKIQPSVVGITVEYTVSSIFSRQSTASAEGSGVIISEDGYILTNNHIVNTSSTSSYYQLSQATKISVYLYNDDTEYEAKIIGTDSQTDLAVIKIEKSGLTAATLGNSDGVRVGEFVMAARQPSWYAK